MEATEDNASTEPAPPTGSTTSAAPVKPTGNAAGQDDACAESSFDLHSGLHVTDFSETISDDLINRLFRS